MKEAESKAKSITDQRDYLNHEFKNRDNSLSMKGKRHENNNRK